MNITLLTAASSEYWELLEVGAPNKLEYCLKHQVQFSMRKHQNAAKERQVFMIDALTECDWLWFMGADTLIMNYDINVRQFLDEEYDFIIGEDINGINNDVFFLKNNARSHDFLNKVITLNNTEAHDQDSMVKIIKEGLIPEFKTKIVHQKQFNSYIYSEYRYPDDKGGSYTRGDFIIHLPGINNARRITIMKELLKNKT